MDIQLALYNILLRRQLFPFTLIEKRIKFSGMLMSSFAVGVLI